MYVLMHCRDKLCKADALNVIKMFDSWCGKLAPLKSFNFNLEKNCKWSYHSRGVSKLTGTKIIFTASL